MYIFIPEYRKMLSIPSATGCVPVRIPNEVLGCSVLTDDEDLRTPKPVCKLTKHSSLDRSHSMVMPGWGVSKLAYGCLQCSSLDRFVYWESSGDGKMLGRSLEVKFESWFGDKCDFRGS